MWGAHKRAGTPLIVVMLLCATSTFEIGYCAFLRTYIYINKHLNVYFIVRNERWLYEAQFRRNIIYQH